MKERYKIIRCGQLYDGVTAEWKPGQSILVDGGRIAAVGAQVPEPENALEIDLPGDARHDRRAHAHGLY